MTQQELDHTLDLIRATPYYNGCIWKTANIQETVEHSNSFNQALSKALHLGLIEEEAV